MLSLRKVWCPPSTSRSAGRSRPCATRGIPIVGSGLSFHDLRRFRGGDTTASAAFDGWLDETAKAPTPARATTLGAWEQGALGAGLTRARNTLPLMVVAGAAGESKGTRDFNDKIGGKMISAFRFG